MDVSVIIVSFNTKELLRNCLTSLINHTSGLTYEIIVVDNASTDGSSQMIKQEFPSVLLIENEENSGFGSANNLGAAKSSGNYLFFLNPDCLLLNNAILIFSEYMEKNIRKGEIGAVGGMLLNENRELNSSFQRFPGIFSSLWFDYVYYIRKLFGLSSPQPGKINYRQISDESSEVDFIVGADLFMPAAFFYSLGGFDERFFLFFEETDLQKRLADKGLKRMILRGPEIVHLEGASAKASVKTLRTTTIFKNSMFLYFRKHYSAFHYKVFYILMFPLLLIISLRPDIPCEERKVFFKMVRRNF